MPVISYISLKQLLNGIQNQLRLSYPASYWVMAEIAGVRQSGNHVYFDLLELEKGAKVAQIRGTAFLGAGTEAITAFEKETGQKFTNGIKIGARVGVNFHPVYGLSLTLYEIDAQLTLGGIELQRKETLEKILREYPQLIRFSDGRYLTPNNKLEIPQVIQRIALVTSPGSDAYNDFMHCLATNEHRYKFKVDEYNVLVQGYGAQAALTGALSRIQTKGGYDAVVMIRGGGAPADFLPFDDYSLALQVATFPIPIITGIGHHTNQGLCDFFASVHTKTPSMAAQYILDRNTSFEKRVQELSGMLRELSGRVLRHQREQIEEVQRELKDGLREMIFSRNVKINAIQSAITGNVSVIVNRQASLLQTKQINLSHRSRILLSAFERQLSARTASLAFLPLQQIRMEKQKSAGLKEQLLGRTPQLLTARLKELEFYKENIRNLSPQRILERGFAMIKKDGRILSSASDIKPGDHLEIIHGDAVLQTEVEKKSKYNGREFNV